MRLQGIPKLRWKYIRLGWKQFLEEHVKNQMNFDENIELLKTTTMTLSNDRKGGEWLDNRNKKKTIYRTPRLNKKKLAKFKKSLHQEYSTTQLQKRRRGDIGRTSYSWWTSITSRMSHHFRNISVCFWIISVNFRSMSTWESYQKTSVDFWSLMNTESY